ncbi:MAG: D-alanyl-D-alanine carboxypeptidase/D-alanyl-D-alanine-endopeptidase [Proteobacteria bacterium]|nr:D-alanyl-D-alanine carboxypeptidase/D-alanyl-D-alanine-endopeptidase [Pseudomonadota bacterium]
MKHSLKVILLCSAPILCVLGWGADTSRTQPELTQIREKVTKWVDQVIPPKKSKEIKVGIIVGSVSTGEILFERNSESLFIPASVSKIFTSYSVLKRLKPNFTFKTGIFVSGSVNDGKLSGDLYVRGSGDPSLVSERMWLLVNEFVRSGIKTIQGNIIIDSSYFDSEKNPETRPKYLKDQAYNAPVGAFSFNFNTTTIFVNPADGPGKPPKVYTDPDNSYIDVVNQATTGKPDSSLTIQVSRTEYVKGDLGDTVLLRGSIPMGHKELRFYRNIVNPALYSGHMLKTFMEQRGLRVEGTVVEGSVSPSAKQVIEFESQPLWHIVWGLNKFSNNFVADQLMKKLGAEMWGPPGTLQKGVAAIQDIVEDLGFPKNSFSIVDGSGLTRSTQVTPKMIYQVLLSAHQDFGMYPEFISSLGIAGEDGTLRNRIPGSDNQAPLRGKTGTLDGVSSLAGYVPSKDGELLAFAILLNDPKLQQGRMSGWVDQIAKHFREISRR